MNEEELKKEILNIVSPFEQTKGGDNLYIEENFKLGLSLMYQKAKEHFLKRMKEIGNIHCSYYEKWRVLKKELEGENEIRF